MPSQTFPITQSGVVLGGAWDDVFAASARAKACFGRYSTMDFAATGTDCTLRYAVAGAVVVEVSIDGGAFVALTNPSPINTYGDVTLFSGLSDGPHSVTIKKTSTTTPLWSVHHASAVTVTGAAPAISASTPFANGTIYDSAALLGIGGADGAWCATAWMNFSFGYMRPSGLTSRYQDASIRFRGNPTSIKVFCYTNGAAFRVYQDGVAVGSRVAATGAACSPVSADSTMGWLELASGLTGTHTYHIVVCNATQATIAQVMLVGGTVDFATTFTRRGAIVVLGDSITAGVSGTADDSTLSYGWKLGLAKNRPVMNGGIGSTFLMSDPTRSVPGTTSRYTDATVYAHQGMTPSHVIVLIGVNDINATTAPDATTFRACYSSMLSAIRWTVGPTCKIIAVGILPTTASNASGRRATYNPEISGAVSDQSDANTVYVASDLLWGTGGNPPTAGEINANTTDGLHPTATGYDALVTLLSPQVSTWDDSAGGIPQQAQLF